MADRAWKILADLEKARRIRKAAYTERDKQIYLFNNFHTLKRIRVKEGYWGNVIKILRI